jgi:hypothetical protein
MLRRCHAAGPARGGVFHTLHRWARMAGGERTHGTSADIVRTEMWFSFQRAAFIYYLEQSAQRAEYALRAYQETCLQQRKPQPPHPLCRCPSSPWSRRPCRGCSAAMQAPAAANRNERAATQPPQHHDSHHHTTVITCSMLLRQNSIVSLENQYERCAKAALTPGRNRYKKRKKRLFLDEKKRRRAPSLTVFFNTKSMRPSASAAADVAAAAAAADAPR